jgi:hypothetical protein
MIVADSASGPPTKTIKAPAGSLIHQLMAPG